MAGRRWEPRARGKRALAWRFYSPPTRVASLRHKKRPVLLLFLARVSAAVRRGEREGGRGGEGAPEALYQMHASTVARSTGSRCAGARRAGALQIASVAFGPRRRAARLVLMLFTKGGSAQVQRSEYNGERQRGWARRRRPCARSFQRRLYWRGLLPSTLRRVPAQAATREGRKHTSVQ